MFRLLADSQPGDMLLTEQVDRLARLTAEDWQALRAEIDAKQVRIVALDLPTSWSLAKADDEFTGRMLSDVNGTLLDMLAAIARKDYVDRRRRQAEGTAKAKAAGRYRGASGGPPTKRWDSRHAPGGLTLAANLRRVWV